MTDQAAKNGIVAMTRIPLYSMSNEKIEGISYWNCNGREHHFTHSVDPGQNH